MKKLLILFVLPLFFSVIRPTEAIAPPFSGGIIAATDYSGDCGQSKADPHSSPQTGVFTEINLTFTSELTDFNFGTYMDMFNIIVQDAHGNKITHLFNSVSQAGPTQLNVSVRINSMPNPQYLLPTTAPTSRPWTFFIQDMNMGSPISYGPLIEVFSFDPANYMPSCASLPYVERSTTTPLVNAGLYTDELTAYNATDDNGEPALHIYDINNEGNGTLALEITQDIIAPYIDNPPAENTELMISDNGNVTLYILDTGELQINRGPDEEGKTHVLIFDGIPPTSVYGYVIDPPMFP